MKIYDNKGRTFDRYTIVTDTGAVYAMNGSPLSPSGINQFSCTEKDFYPSELVGELVTDPRELPDDVCRTILYRIMETEP